MPRKLPPIWVTRDSSSKHGLTAIERAVLLCLWDHANGELETWPSQPTIASEIGAAKRSVAAALETLELRGFIARANVMIYTNRTHSRHSVQWKLTTAPRQLLTPNR